jgi:hypothetical protein
MKEPISETSADLTPIFCHIMSRPPYNYVHPYIIRIMLVMLCVQGGKWEITDTEKRGIKCTGAKILVRRG